MKDKINLDMYRFPRKSREYRWHQPKRPTLDGRFQTIFGLPKQESACCP